MQMLFLLIAAPSSHQAFICFGYRALQRNYKALFEILQDFPGPLLTWLLNTRTLLWLMRLSNKRPCNLHLTYLRMLKVQNIIAIYFKPFQLSLPACACAQQDHVCGQETNLTPGISGSLGEWFSFCSRCLSRHKGLSSLWEIGKNTASFQRTHALTDAVPQLEAKHADGKPPLILYLIVFERFEIKRFNLHQSKIDILKHITSYSGS